jgi:hypothetical protein
MLGTSLFTRSRALQGISSELKSELFAGPSSTYKCSTKVQDEEEELIPSPSTDPNSYKEGRWILKEWSRFSRKEARCEEIYRYVSLLKNRIS